MCEWGKDAPWVWGGAIAQSWRMAGDHTGNWKSTKKIVGLSAAVPAENTGRPYAWNDMDMLVSGHVRRSPVRRDSPEEEEGAPPGEDGQP